jgi:uncharacterized protein (DUF433 family)
MNWRDRITTVADVLLGKPCVKRTRISVELILGRLADGWTFETMLEARSATSRTCATG